MREKIYLILAIAICLGFGFWVLGFWGGGCASSRPELSATTTSFSGSTTTTIPVIKGWQVVGEAEFALAGSTGSPLFVYGGVPYVSADKQVRRYSGTTWECLGDLTMVGLSSGTSSLFVYNGDPYIVGSPYLPPLYGATSTSVFKFNGTTWESLGSGFTSDLPPASYYAELYIDNGTPYVAYINQVKSYNGSDWQNVGPPGPFIIGGAPPNSRQLFVYNGTPYVAYLQAWDPILEASFATVVKFNGSTWETVGQPSISLGNATCLSLFIYNGTPYIAYCDKAYERIMGTNKPIHYAKATVREFNGTIWEDVGTAGFSADEAVNTDLFVYNGTPYVIFQDNSFPNGLGRASLMKYDGSNWVYVGSQGFNGNHTAMYDTIFIDNGTIYIAYRDATSGKLTVMKYIE
jgi:hypothetical protein